MLTGLRAAAKGYSNLIVDIRGKGMLMAMEFPNDQLGFEVSKAMLERGVLVSGTLVNARVIRVEPPLTLTEDQADYVCKALGESLAAVAKGM
jgi:putrescine aminotransferase